MSQSIRANTLQRVALHVKIKYMTRYYFQAMYGSLLATTAIIMAVLSFSPSQIMQYVTAAGLMTASAFALITAYKSKNREIQQKHNLLQSFGMFGHGFTIFLMGSSLSQFIMINLAFLVYFGITEILFAFELSSYKRKMNRSVVGFKMGNGLLVAIGAVVAFGTSHYNQTAALLVTSGITLLMGIGFVLLAWHIRVVPAKLSIDPAASTDRIRTNTIY